MSFKRNPKNIELDGVDSDLSALRMRYDQNRSGKIKIGNAILAEKAKKDSGWKFSIALLRMREIEKIIRHRHGSHIPESDDADIYIEAAILTCSGQDMKAWCWRWSPWIMERYEEIVAPLEWKHRRRKRGQRADDVGKMLHVSNTERTKLDLRTIGSFDIPKAERDRLAKERKKERDRTYQEQRRKAAGAQNRQSYEAESVEQKKPWVEMNMSRRTWYRRGRPMRGTGPSHIVYTNGKDDGLVPTVQKAPQAVPPRPSVHIEKSTVAVGNPHKAVRQAEGVGAHSHSEQPPSDRHHLPARPVSLDGAAKKKAG